MEFLTGHHGGRNKISSEEFRHIHGRLVVVVVVVSLLIKIYLKTGIINYSTKQSLNRKISVLNSSLQMLVIIKVAFN